MRRFALVSVLTVLPALCSAQVPAVLGECIVAKLSPTDRQDLARWVFLSMATHPEVKPLAAENGEATQAAARKVGALFTHTLRDTCAEQAKEAAQAGGPPVVASTIHFFTQLGVQELMTNKDVLASLASFGPFADREGIDRAVRAK